MPKKKAVDIRVTGTPSEVAERLKQATRYSVQPVRGGPWTFGDKPLKGMVTERGATVGLNRRDWMSLMQPTAQLTFEESGAGTRVHGMLGIPDWLVWLMRFGVVVGVPFAVGAAAFGLLADGSAGTTALAAGFAAFAVLVTIFGVGMNMNNADGQMNDLEQAVRRWTSASGVPLDAETDALSEEMREAAPGVRAGMDALRE